MEVGGCHHQRVEPTSLARSCSVLSVELSRGRRDARSPHHGQSLTFRNTVRFFWMHSAASLRIWGSTEALEGTVPTQQSARPGTCLSHADRFISQKNALLYCEIGFLTTWSNVSQGSSGLCEVDTELLMLCLVLRVLGYSPVLPCLCCAVSGRNPGFMYPGQHFPM